jgi:hypothetical protein
LHEVLAFIHAAAVANVSYPLSNFNTNTQDVTGCSSANFTKFVVVACGLHVVPVPSEGEIFAGLPLTVAHIISPKVALSLPQLLRSLIK